MLSPISSRTNRFQSFTPLRNSTASLRRLKTAFSPTRATRSMSQSSASSASATSTCTTSPLSRNASPHSYRSNSSSYSPSSSSPSSTARIRQILSVRRKPSMLEFEMEEERHLFGAELGVLEPRPVMYYGSSAAGGEVCVAGIFEVLDGKC